MVSAFPKEPEHPARIQPDCAQTPPVTTDSAVPSTTLISSLQNRNSHTQLTELLRDKCKARDAQLMLRASHTFCCLPAGPRAATGVAHSRAVQDPCP